MMKDREGIRILLVQARDEPHMLRQEQMCFAERTELALDQLTPCNVIEGTLSPADLHGVDGVMIGGAGRYSATHTYPWTQSLLDVIVQCCDEALPLFGSCWGHQMIARALGGKVIHDLERAELGCFGVSLTEAGRHDPLFCELPHSFLTNMGHHDRVAELPPGAVELAHNESQPFQAFRIDELPVYGTQFHSELDAVRERERLLEYRDEYRSALPDESDFDRVLAAAGQQLGIG